MKTFIASNIQATGSDSQQMLVQFHELNQHLPEAIYQDKLFQTFYQVGLLGEDRDCYGFFETSEEYGIKLPADALVGSISVRVDYDPNYNYNGEDETPEYPSTESLIRHLCLALAQPHNPVMYPDRGEIDHIRVSIVVAPGKEITKTYWPQQLGLYIDPAKMFY